MIKVLIVEDQRMSRENIERELSASGKYGIAGSITDAELALTMCRRQKVDLVLMDVCTNGKMDGIIAAKEIKESFPGIKVIIITSMVEVSFIERAKAAGADSFWYKEDENEPLLEIIEKTMAGEEIYPDKTPSVMIGNASSEDFTPAEIRVLRLICEGLGYEEIAEKLYISVNTVKAHTSHILQKTGYSNKLRLAIAVTNKNFIIPKLEDEE